MIGNKVVSLELFSNLGFSVSDARRLHPKAWKPPNLKTPNHLWLIERGKKRDSDEEEMRQPKS